MANLVKNILEMLITASELPSDWSALPKIIDAFFSFHENSQLSDYMDIMREKSQAAYDEYCQDWEIHSRGDYIGIPDKKQVLAYWAHCMEENIYPNKQDFADFVHASEEESEQMLKFLIGQWLTVPDFSVWLHGIANELKQNEIAQILKFLPQMDGMIRRIEESLKILSGNGRGGTPIQFITYQTVMEAQSVSTETQKEAIRDYYKISDNYHTMLRVISAERDIPHEAACAKLDELLQENKPVIIAGNGGLGKSSLMLHEAVQWAQSGKIAVWLPLSAKDVMSESQALEFYHVLTSSFPNDMDILLCIENPYDGREVLKNLRKAWPGNRQIHLLMAERSNRLSALSDQSGSSLIGWFDNAYVLELLATEDADGEQFREQGYHYLPFAEEPNRRRRILDACVTAFTKDIEETRRAQILKSVLQTYDRPHVSLAELIYRTLFELSRNVSKPESVALDWDEWERFIRDALHTNANADMYGVVAAFKLFDTPLTLSFFCRLFKKIDKEEMERELPQHMRNQMEPLIYDEDSETLQPKHDVIAELFFLFHNRVSINRLMKRIINEMDGKETEILLDQMVDKSEFLRGSAYRIDIRYEDYLNQIQKRMESGKITLSTGGRANLCTGNFWLQLKQMRQVAKGAESSAIDACQEKIEAYLAKNAPTMESFVRGEDFLGINFHGMAKLYTEWGMWEQNRGNSVEAEQKFKSVLTMGSKEETLFARTVLGKFLTKQYGRGSEAEKVLNDALEIDPTNIYVLIELGKLLTRQRGRISDAEAVFQRALASDPHNIFALVNLAKLFAQQRGRVADAEDYFHRALKNDPTNVYALTAFGEWLRKQHGQEVRAESVLQEALKIDSQNIRVLRELGILLAKQRKWDKAEPFFQEALKIAPNNIQICVELAKWLAKQDGRELDAEAAFQRALKIDQNHLPAITGLGRLLSNQDGREAEAESFFQKALKIDSNSLPALTGLGRLLTKQSEREKEAETYLCEVIRMAPKYSDARDALAHLYEKQSKYPEALKQYQELCRLLPKNSIGNIHAKEGIERLKKRMSNS
ncbi:MAG: tetratricopeptide repeat protein [Oscillibacter sp.]|nr:tetratricopeptide repeat protein [Oscillibacter sp.]